MTISAYAHQKQVDDAAERDELKEQWQAAALEHLTALKHFEYPDLTRHGMLTEDYVTDFDVMEAVDNQSRSEVTLAFSLLDANPDEALRILREARDKAVADLLSDIDFNTVAKAVQEQQKREAA